jgi:LruC domain-containing protein
MRKIFILAALLYTVNGFTQNTLTLTAESGNRAVETGNCWGFGAASYYATGSGLTTITGNWSVRSNSPTNLDPNACWVKTPWFKPGSGNITFKVKFESNTTVTTRRIILSYAPFDAASTSSSKEGTMIRFDSISYSGAITNAIQNLSFAIPAAIANSNDPYKIRISFVGTGGTVRYNADDFVIPGTYFADPTNSCLPIAGVADTDSDGVNDTEDQFPQDATRAYVRNYPATGFGTLLFEDQWPNNGDYDFNDLALGYRYQYITNASNQMVELKGTIVIRAIGATFRNGFAIQLDNLAATKVASVTGTKTQAAPWLSVGTNGTENGQTNANIIVIDNASRIIPPPTAGTLINTDPSLAATPTDTTNFTITFNAGEVVEADININPYIFINQDRSREVHLADRIPSAKMNPVYFGTIDDASSPGIGKYYRNRNNLPWALDIPESVPYPVERVDITSAYLLLAAWAQSNGTTNTNWFADIAGARNATKLYSR